MRIKLLFNYKNLNQKLNQIKFIKELFGLGLKEAKDTVDSGEFIPQCECDGNIVEMIRSNSNANIEVNTFSTRNRKNISTNSLFTSTKSIPSRMYSS